MLNEPLPPGPWPPALALFSGPWPVASPLIVIFHPARTARRVPFSLCRVALAAFPGWLGLSDTKIKFSFAGTTLTSKLIDGTFPDYDRVIPEGNDKILEVETELFAQAVDRVSAISAEKSRAVKLSISKGNLILSANSAENDTANETIQVDYDDAEIEIGFNSRYLLDIAQQIEFCINLRHFCK